MRRMSDSEVKRAGGLAGDSGGDESGASLQTPGCLATALQRFFAAAGVVAQCLGQPDFEPQIFGLLLRSAPQQHRRRFDIGFPSGPEPRHCIQIADSPLQQWAFDFKAPTTCELLGKQRKCLLGIPFIKQLFDRTDD